MSKKKEYLKMNEKDLKSILGLSKKSLRETNEKVSFDINYRHHNPFGSLQREKEELQNTIININEILKERNKVKEVK